MRYALIFFFVFTFRISSAQKEDYTWVLSDPFVIKFNQDSIEKVDTFINYHGLAFFNTSFTQSDSIGVLQYYTNGAYIYNRLGEVMDGCDTFVSPSQYILGIADHGNGVGAGSAQGVVGFRKPGSDHLYYLFHNISSDCAYPDGWACYLYYSLIDMSENNGMGKVIDLNHIVYAENTTYLSHTAINACKHANGRDWWLVQGKALKQEENLVFLIDENGIHNPILQTIGDTTVLANVSGRLLFSQDGSIMAKAPGVGRTNLFDFNRCDGSISNPRFIKTFDPAAGGIDSLAICASIAFSPSGRFLYVNTISKVFQYDLWADDVQGSEIKIWDLDTLNSDYTLFVMQLAPDGRIYIGAHSSGSDRKNLTVINKPNEKGAACDFRYGGVPFPNMKWHGLGLPNMPNVRLEAGPMFTADAGKDQTVCKDSIIQIGEGFSSVDASYSWSSSDSDAFISENNILTPLVSTTKPITYFYLTITAVASSWACFERTDTVSLLTYDCTTSAPSFPNFINAALNPYFSISNQLAGTSLRVFATSGQLIFSSNNYANNWNVSESGPGVYIIEIINGFKITRKEVIVVN